MQPDYLDRLSEPVKQFVRQVEERSGIAIHVIPEKQLNGGGPTGHGELQIFITDHSIQLFAPSNGYFPDGAVRHELLHADRFHVQGVPKLALAEQAWDRSFADALTHIDNAIEHVIIVPLEIELHPERRGHWEALMEKVWFDAPSNPPDQRRLAACLHWTFLRSVLPDSPQIQVASDFIEKHGLRAELDEFFERFHSLKASKKDLVGYLLQSFPEIRRYHPALEYVSSLTGTRQVTIPDC